MLSADSRKRFELARRGEATFDDPVNLRGALLDFIADFSNWDNSTSQEFLETTRRITAAAFESCGGSVGTKPLLFDPFAGGGAIPLEGLRVGCQSFASDLNPVSVAINKVVLEYGPRHGQALIDEIVRAIEVIQRDAREELGDYFGQDPDGRQPIAYLWARTVLSEAPDTEGEAPVEIPLLKTLWLARKGVKKALRWRRNKAGHVQTELSAVTYQNGRRLTVRRPTLEVFEPQVDSDVEPGTVSGNLITV